MSSPSRVVGAGALLVVIFASGFWSSRSGKPYNVFASTIHKLSGVGLGILLILTVVQTKQVGTLGGTKTIAVLVTIVLFLSLVASGGLLMGKKEMPALVRHLHHLAPYLTTLSTAATLYLLLRSW